MDLDINLDDLNYDLDTDFPEFNDANIESNDDINIDTVGTVEDMEKYVLSLPLDKKINFLLDVTEKQIGRKLYRTEKRERINYYKRLAKKGKLDKLLIINK